MYWPVEILSPPCTATMSSMEQKKTIHVLLPTTFYRLFLLASKTECIVSKPVFPIIPCANPDSLAIKTSAKKLKQQPYGVAWDPRPQRMRARARIQNLATSPPNSPRIPNASIRSSRLPTTTTLTVAVAAPRRNRIQLQPPRRRLATITTFLLCSPSRARV
jgi:hypothetical protein